MIPLVAIRCITYNHEPYIRDALEGFVMQQTNFPFVAIVHDDASTDCTADIIREYAAKYPHIIKPIYETENQYSKGDGSMPRMMNRAVVATGAKYIALCEGDDYWTDPLKLQKQVDFLESHPDYSLVFHSVKFINEFGHEFPCYHQLREGEYRISDYGRKFRISTCSVMTVKAVVESIPHHPKFKVGDIVWWYTAARFGKLYCLRQTMAVYHRHEGGWSTQNKEKIWTDLILHFEAMRNVFPEQKQLYFKENIASCTLFLALNTIRKHSFMTGFKQFFSGFKYPLVYSRHILNFVSAFIMHKIGLRK